MACYFDYRQNRIPNGLIIIGLVGSFYYIFKEFIFYSLSNKQILAFVSKFILKFIFFSFVIFLILYLFYKLGMIGAGDVKLYTVATLYLTPNQFLFFLLCSMILGAVMAMIQLIRLKNLRERLSYFFAYAVEVLLSRKFFLYLPNKSEPKKSSIHLAGPMLAGCILCIFLTK